MLFGLIQVGRFGTRSRMFQVNWECKTFLFLEEIVGFTEDVSQKEFINF